MKQVGSRSGRLLVIAATAALLGGCAGHETASQKVAKQEQSVDAHQPNGGDQNASPARATLAESKDKTAGQPAPVQQNLKPLEVVATFNGPMPTGVTVSRSGRIFINFPKWGDPVGFTVAELKGGQAVPYPSAELNKEDLAHPERVLLAVQSVVVDAKDRLWILDTGSILFGKTSPGGPKLVGVDLATNQVFKTILFPQDVALPTTYLNDVRFDLTRGAAGMAFITDSSTAGSNGLIVVDLDSGKSWRRLNDHPSTKAEPNFVPIVEGQPLHAQPSATVPPKPLTFGSDGIAISNDGKRLYYCPLASHHLYSVSVDALCDRGRSEAQVAATIEDLGTKPASDGLETDSQNRIYLTDYEHNAIHRRSPDGRTETIVQDPRAIWPDTMSLAHDGYLYFTANQLDRAPQFHGGQDHRQKPYVLFRVQTDGKPVEHGK